MSEDGLRSRRSVMMLSTLLLSLQTIFGAVPSFTKLYQENPIGSIDGSCGDKTIEKNSFLWTIQRDPPSYFFGTIHVPYTKVWDHIQENMRDAFDRSDHIYFELDLTDIYTINTLANCQLLPQGEYLVDIIPKDLYQRLRLHLEYVKQQMPSWILDEAKGNEGRYADYLFNAIAGNWEIKRPIWVMLMVNTMTEKEIRSRGIPVLDLYLAQEAERMGKGTGAVERVEEQCLPFNELSLKQVLFALNQTLLVLEAQRGELIDQGDRLTTEDLIHYYNCGNLNEVVFDHDTAQVPSIVNMSLEPKDVIMAQHIDNYFREELILKRNKRMADRVAGLLEKNPEKSFFFAFGAGHFIGNSTVIDKLSELGYKVEHTQHNDKVYLGSEQIAKKKKNDPYSRIVVPGKVPTIDMDVSEKRKHRHRNKQRGQRPKKKNRRLHEDEDVFEVDSILTATDSHQIKQPNFNELWVRLDSTSFKPNSYINKQNEQVQEHTTPGYPGVNAARSNNYLSLIFLTPILLVCNILVNR